MSDRFRPRDVVAFRREQQCGRCVWCGQLAAPMDDPWSKPSSPTLEHIQPVSMGGKDSMRNMVMAHYACNQVRGTNYQIWPRKQVMMLLPVSVRSQVNRFLQRKYMITWNGGRPIVSQIYLPGEDV